MNKNKTFRKCKRKVHYLFGIVETYLEHFGGGKSYDHNNNNNNKIL